MNIFQRSCCSISGVLLVFLLQGSCVNPEAVIVHKAVGDSLDLTANLIDISKDLEVKWKYNDSLFAEYENYEIKEVNPEVFHKRLKINNESISVTIKDLNLQDSGIFLIVATQNTQQLPTNTIELHVHDLITDVQIEYRLLKNCTFNLECRAVGDLNPSYSWSGHQIQTGAHLNISLHPAQNATVTCTADNTVSIKFTTKTVVCSEKPEDPREPSGLGQKSLLIAVGVGIVAVVIFSGSVIVCCKQRKHKGQKESDAGLTVYEDVNTDGTAKKRSESVVNGTSIYETVNDMNIKQTLPQTLYDKISYQRHPVVSSTTSSPYQEVL